MYQYIITKLLKGSINGKYLPVCNLKASLAVKILAFAKPEKVTLQKKVRVLSNERVTNSAIPIACNTIAY